MNEASPANATVASATAGAARARRRRAWLVRWLDFFGQDVWRRELEGLPLWRALLLRALRVGYLAVRGLFQNDCPQKAAALTYTTVLSLVPLLAFAFSVAKGFGAYDYLLENTVRPFLDYAFGELPADEMADAATTGALEIRRYLEDLLAVVHRTDFSSLGMFGLLFLLLTAVRLLMGIERSLNQVFGVHEGRSFVRRISDYVALLVIAPILTITATAVTGAGVERVVSWLGIEMDIGPLLRLLVLFVIWTVFALIYLVIPNTRVPLVSALVGGAAGGTVFHVVNLLYVWVQREVTNYSAIYAGFAAVPVFLVWLFTCWVTVLLGAHVAWAHMAEPGMREVMRTDPPEPAEREVLAVRACAAVARAFLGGEEKPTATELAARLSVPLPFLDQVLEPLVEGGILARADDDGAFVYLPARDPARVRVRDVIDVLNGALEEHDQPADPAEAAVLELRDEERRSAANRTIAELARAADGEVAAARA